MLPTLRFLVTFLVAAATIGLTIFYKEKLVNHHMSSSKKEVVELVLTPLGVPHPYSLNFVAQYRLVQQVCEFLVRRDDHQNIVPGLADSWDIGADRKSITFNIRKKIYNAFEVKQSLLRFMAAGQTSHSNLNAQIRSSESIEVINDSSLKIHTTGDAGAILAPLVMADACILPDDHWVKTSDSEFVDWSKTKGPYRLVSGNLPLGVGESLIYEPNKDHYMYSEEMLQWKVEYRPLSSLKSLNDFESLFIGRYAYTTLRYWDLMKLVEELPVSNIPYYQTRPNGISFLAVNLRNGPLTKVAIRKQLLKNMFDSNINLIDPTMRAFQIAQPGLSGKMDSEEQARVQKSILSVPSQNDLPSLRWLIPNGPGENSAWVEGLANASKFPLTLVYDTYAAATDKSQRLDRFDVALLSVGMSDTDPISGASFLFSPKALGQDFADGRILRILNEAKATNDPLVIQESVKNAFRLSLEDGQIIPICYVYNRHYHSAGIDLDIKDPYSESTRIWDVRIEN